MEKRNIRPAWIKRTKNPYITHAGALTRLNNDALDARSATIMYKYTDDIFSIPGSFVNGVKEQTSPRIVAKSVEQVPLSKIVIPKEEKVLLIKVPAYCERNEARNEMPSRKTMSAAESSAFFVSEDVSHLPGTAGDVLSAALHRRSHLSLYFTR